ncbi:flagellar hook-associated protein 3 [Thioflavicoccus mobilis 8321]|uniref:Flagellar hook-associated protein 3 n=1 Tax=Thioflavicoccus mobilis 8321 TaxID=765912 RepID=L0H3B7_9GAMM|nr:flagellar hook-associated protein FlgL [Thioflavicoccus mobilis]AGA92155.1 flagellar hook-associated protein 3 [Thioflavicoccus mobilis 8321]
MRIATQQLHERAVSLMLERQSQLASTQQQLATGKRFVSASEDPTAAAAAMRLTREIASLERYQANADLAEAQQTAEEYALAEVTEVLHGVRELIVQGDNGSLNDDDRRTLAADLDQRLETLLGLANTRYGDEYLFAGLKSGTRPFSSDGRGQFTYLGDAGQRMLNVGPDVRTAVNDPGSEVFQGIRAGNGVFETAADAENTGSGVISVGTQVGDFVADDYVIAFSRSVPDGDMTYTVLDGSGEVVVGGQYQSGAAIRFNGAEVVISDAPADGDEFSIKTAGRQDIFSILHSAARALEVTGDGPQASAQRQIALDRSLAELDGALNQVLAKRAGVGARLNQVETQREANAAFQLTAEEALSDTQDLDYAEAAMRLRTQLVGLEAAQRSFLMIQDLSLFRLIG